MPPAPSPNRAIAACCALFLLVVGGLAPPVAAHHILGRPSYNLNEDSNTPSSLQGEVMLGEYSVTYMVFPAFPQPGAPGRINVYATRNTDGKPFDGEVTFSVRERGWLSFLGVRKPAEEMGRQRLDDGVYRQAFAFKTAGDYMVSASFTAANQPYVVDFPLRVGPPPALGPIGIAVGLIALLLISVSLMQRRRAMTGKTRASHEDREG